MTDTLAPHQRATHADGLAVFQAALTFLESVGWTRRAVDTLTRPDNDWQVRHHYSAGCWELHFERQPYWIQVEHSSVPATTDPREALIDRHRSLPSVRAVISQLFGPYVHLAAPLARANGATQDPE